MAESASEPFVEEGVDALAYLTTLLENRRLIVAGAIIIGLAVGGIVALTPRKYKAELSLTPVVNNRSASALGGIAALAGATLQTGYQLTPARMVELIKSRTVLAGVGLSPVAAGSRETIIDRVMGKEYLRNDPEEVQKQIQRRLSVGANKETGTVTVAIRHPDSGLARMVASRVVDSASQIFVRTSRAQAHQLRVAQEARVENAAAQLAAAEERLRSFNFANRAAPAYSSAGLERERLNRAIQLAEQVYTQAAQDREMAFAQELQSTPTVVIQDPLPDVLPKVRKRIILKTAIAGIVSFVFLSLAVILIEITRRRLLRRDLESDRFMQVIASLPGGRRRLRLDSD